LKARATPVLSGKVALVTGAAQGIGAGIAACFARAGARVVLSDVNASLVYVTAEQCGGVAYSHDVSDERGWIDVIASIQAQFGALHILVNNAGVEGDITAAKDPEHATLDDWNRIFAVNSAGTFLGCKHAIPLIVASGGGSIINISSVASLLPVPFIAAYGASKASVEHFTRSVALHSARAGHHIRCNSIHPGQVRTPMLEKGVARMASQAGTPLRDFMLAMQRSIPLGQFQDAEDIGNLAVFLAADESRYITGQAIAVDGGFTLAN
jgi:3(or 17)beta-hydroxysteroid dehydrogenase